MRHRYQLTDEKKELWPRHQRIDEIVRECEQMHAMGTPGYAWMILFTYIDFLEERIEALENAHHD